MASGMPRNFVNYTLSQREIDDFIAAATDGNKAVVAGFIKKYPDAVDERDHYNRTALMWAGRYGRWDIVELLLENGADMGAKDYAGWTTLIHAAACGNEITVEFLLEKGALIDGEDTAGKTALTYARERCKADMVALLEQWPDTKKRRLLAEQKARELRETDFSHGLKKSIPRPRPFKLPQPKQRGTKP